jgi:hypothetical protein
MKAYGGVATENQVRPQPSCTFGQRHAIAMRASVSDALIARA